ncbi:ubiquitin-like domain-containing CTD phosphatase 1 [Aplysia californica]|uniref:Ubiquitin-like domain-containing CTD phosphatase 1 n=1 Tax=Aplysia californica TaxID=6500 RepID=A0ABM0JJ63_APLCA|nr:ubiquitin-like domain-containing CTD phosphatase 1 [Aplysia californica]
MAGEVGDLIVKYSRDEHKISGLLGSDTVKDLKDAIYKLTSVQPNRQKLLGLKVKPSDLVDDMMLSALKLRPNMKLILMGTKEEQIEKVSETPTDLPEVVNDFDIEEEEIAVENREEYLAKIDRRIKSYKINTLNESRPGKKLLVLDIDYTLFDHRSTAEQANELMRPFLHEFLTDAYKNYDIVIWSATGMKWIETKLKLLGVATHPDYKICFYLDSDAMISVHTPKYGVIEVKPLGVIWGKYPEWSEKNTIMLDDIRRNFIMNPQSGLRIKAFRDSRVSRFTDTELIKMTEYLNCIALLEDFTALDHRNWREYRKKSRDKESRTSDRPSTQS